MRALKILIGLAAFAASVASMQRADAQVYVEVANQPVCQYGYYDYQPYACAPYGFYGQGYFYNGIFLGMGPWAGWGYGHGWGSHRFVESGGGSYRGGGGEMANRGHYANPGKPGPRQGGGASNQAHQPRRGSAPRAPSAHSSPRSPAPHGGGSGHPGGHANEEHQ